ncbi:putative transposase [Rhizobium sp. BK650]|nr:putative transposase [Rhizobium sp. BK650]
MPATASVHDYTRYTFTQDDLIRYQARDWCLKSKKTGNVGSEWEGGVLIETCDGKDPPRTEALQYSDISELFRHKEIEWEEGYFSAKNAIARRKGIKIFDMSPATIFRVRMVAEFLEIELDRYETGEYYPRSDAGYEKFIAAFKAENEFLIPPKTGKRAVIPGPRQFGRLVERFEDNELEPTSLAPRHRGRVGQESRFTTDELRFHAEYAQKFQSKDRPTKLDCYVQMSEANDAREASEMPRFDVPSLRTFQRIIDDLGNFRNEVARAGDPMRVIRKFGMSRRGYQPQRPLEVVEMDEHKLDVIRLLVRNGIWDYLHPEVQRRIEEKIGEKNDGRVWLSVALDACSRSVCGMKLLWGGPDGASAVATLAMVARSKEFETQLYGTTTSWVQQGTAESVHVDAGASYTSNEFQQAVMSYTGNVTIPPSKHPHLRGRVERFFRTINQRYIHLLSGQTFSNVLLRDKYDAKKHRHITDDQLADLIVMLIVDCYHNTKHRGLQGMTPLQAWRFFSQNGKGGVKPVPSDEKYAEAFSIVAKYKLGNYGIQILGLPYSNPRLQTLRLCRHDLELSVRVNEIDLSKIQVKDPFSKKPAGDWFEVECAMDGLKGVRVMHWLDQMKYLQSVFGRDAKVAAKVAAKTLADARVFANASKAAAGIASPIATPEMMYHWSKMVVAGFTIVDEAATDYGDGIYGPSVSTDRTDPFAPLPASVGHDVDASVEEAPETEGVLTWVQIMESHNTDSANVGKSEEDES